jgi:hypothetical protein
MTSSLRDVRTRGLRERSQVVNPQGGDLADHVLRQANENAALPGRHGADRPAIPLIRQLDA